MRHVDGKHKCILKPKQFFSGSNSCGKSLFFCFLCLSINVAHFKTRGIFPKLISRRGNYILFRFVCLTSPQRICNPKEFVWAQKQARNHYFCGFLKFGQKKGGGLNSYTLRYVIILMKRREVITQLIVLLYGSKNAPTCILFSALTIISFIQFLVSLRVHLWTASLRNKSSNMSADKLLRNFIIEKNLSKILFFCQFFTLFQVLRLKIVIRLLYVLDIKMSSVR